MNKKQMKQLIQSLTTDDAYKCYTRKGLELFAWPEVSESARYVIFADIDDMHALNARHGYNTVDEMIASAVSFRTSDIHAIGRWFSGDEIIWIVGEGNPEGLAARIMESFRDNGLSATFGIAPITSKDLATNVRAAADLVQQAKNSNQRGTITKA